MLDVDKHHIKTAVALKYDKDKTPTPVVIASGKGHMAEKIIELAEQNKVPMQKNSLLAESLSKLYLGEKVPLDLYEAIAQILVCVMHVDDLVGRQEF